MVGLVRFVRRIARECGGKGEEEEGEDGQAQKQGWQRVGTR